ncbi:aquaporin-like protein, partial [Macrolepiota fuliginosa MF-IS2]
MSRTSTVYLGDIRQRHGIFTIWERQRNRREVHWLMECFAEALGVFLYVFPGVGSTLGFILGNISKEQGLSSLFQIGSAYALGILFALGIAAGTSGGHFNPAVTIAFVLFRGFPVRKALRYIPAQIFGGYVACMLVYYQWKPLIDAMVDGLTAAKEEALLFTPNGPPGAFALYLLPG